MQKTRGQRCGSSLNKTIPWKKLQNNSVSQKTEMLSLNTNINYSLFQTMPKCSCEWNHVSKTNDWKMMHTWTWKQADGKIEQSFVGRSDVLSSTNCSGFLLSDFSSFRFLCVISSSSNINTFRVRYRQSAYKVYIYHMGICSPQTFLQEQDHDDDNSNNNNNGRERGKEGDKKEEHIIWLILSQRYFKANYVE